MFDWMATSSGWFAFATLSVLEIVLGIDNVIFISLLVSRLPREQAKKARAFGMILALGMRIALLFMLTAILGLKEPLLTLPFIEQQFSWRDLILLAGGLFLIVKATHEIHSTVEGEGEHDADTAPPKPRAFAGAMVQIALIDLVFSIDSIITAVGMVQEIGIMIAAVLVAMAVMYVSSAPLSAFISRHPTTKVLALAFLLLVGLALCAEAFEFHIPRGYLYGAMAFAALVEGLNLVMKNRARAAKEAAAIRRSKRVATEAGDVSPS